MARLTIYLDEELLAQVKDAGLNASEVCRAALTRALQSEHVDENGWDFRSHLSEAQHHLEMALDLAVDAEQA